MGPRGILIGIGDSKMAASVAAAVVRRHVPNTRGGG